MTAMDYLIQVLYALAFYAGVVAIMRFAGKRLAGQTTTFDLIILITLSVALQGPTLREGTENTLTFIITVFLAHKSMTSLCVSYPRIRRIIRGGPCCLVRDGRIVQAALERESMTREELLAGLRKLGFSSEEEVSVAMLEETGHISAVKR
jgi:uncharacterized membrane protein YcaP (DUF421 family)